MTPVVEFRHISKQFGAVKANQNISFSVAKGSIHGIVGENGAGKSTLMSILYGYYQADSGTILLGGAPPQEPMVVGGPFVMDCAAAIHRAEQDYGAGKMGRLAE